MTYARWAWVLGVALLLAPATWADDPIGRISFGPSGGYSSYQLGSVNSRISSAGNTWLQEQGWTTLSELKHGWTFWGDAKVRLPLSLLGVREVFGIPLDFFVTGGYGVSSGSSGGDDYNELITIKAAQTATHFRLLYVVPWRLHEDVRLFVGGGPLLISEQKVTATHTSRRSAGGGSTARETSRTEEVTYRGDGSGVQLGVNLEYYLQDHLTLALDLGYRWSDISYGAWVAANDVSITDTDPVVEDDWNSLERLRRDVSYVFHSFLDAERTEREELLITGRLHEYGPHMDQLKPLGSGDLGIDLSGLQVHLGFRVYLF